MNNAIHVVTVMLIILATALAVTDDITTAEQLIISILALIYQRTGHET